ncbi:MAG TPA: glycosyltransferase family 4 protein [Verrucomicrobiae bacterium]
MNIVQITPGAGGMYCGNCFRDNAMVAAWRKQGHNTLMIPLYLPMTLDEEDQSKGVPTFFNGVNVYLEQQSAWYRSAPKWLHKILASPILLKLASGRAAKTQATDVVDIAISMLKGEEGNQARELEELIAYLKPQNHPDAISLSNAMLIGLARRMKQELKSSVVCMLQGEDAFIDSMPEEGSNAMWRLLAERAKEVDLFIAPSRYFGERMMAKMQIPANKLKVVYNGINLAGYPTTVPPISTNTAPVIGFFARMCKDKGLDSVVEAFLSLKQRNRVPGLKLKIGGGCGPSDEPFVEQLKMRLQRAGFIGDVSFHPNLSREEKLEFFQGLSVFTVPALYGEAFGLYVIESLASGVPVVQPRVASFPELVETTGGGALYEPGSPGALANALEATLIDTRHLRTMAETGHRMVHSRFSIESMAEHMAKAFAELKQPTVSR